MSIFKHIAEKLDGEYELSINIHPQVSVEGFSTQLGPWTFLSTYSGNLPLLGPIICVHPPPYNDALKALKHTRECIIQETDACHRETPTPLDQVLEAALLVPDKKLIARAMNFLTLGAVRRREAIRMDTIGLACLGWGILEHVIQVQAEACPEPAARQYRSLEYVTTDARQRMRRLANKWVRDGNPLDLPNPLEELAKYEEEIVTKFVGAEKWH